MRNIKSLLFLFVFTLSIHALSDNVPFIGNAAITAVEAGDEAEKVTDAVCGMKIDKSSAKVVDVSGKNFYFCSDKCKTTFEDNPGKVTCMCFVGLEEGDEPCGCNHCSGKGGKCTCADEHEEGHDHHEHHEHG
ncbi:MAG: YHS domain-containing protein [Candidatus Anammoxibacter sp.]